MLRPATLPAGGLASYLEEGELTLASDANGEPRVLRVARLHPGGKGVAVRLLRGVYTLRVTETAATFPESTVLDLSGVPPPMDGSEHELVVPLFAKPLLRVEIAVPANATAPGSLSLPHCEAKVSDVTVLVRESSTGREFFAQPVPHAVQGATDMRPGEASGVAYQRVLALEPLNFDLSSFKVGQPPLPVAFFSANWFPLLPCWSWPDSLPLSSSLTRTHTAVTVAIGLVPSAGSHTAVGHLTRRAAARRLRGGRPES